jgi:hypothetical protein
MLLQFDNTGSLARLTAFGSALADDCCTDMNSDQSGKIWMTGKIGDSALFNNRCIRTAGSCDAFAMAFDTMGNPLSATMLGGTTFDQGCGITCNDTEIVITGYFSGTMQAGQTSLSGQPSTCFDLFVASLETSLAEPFDRLPFWENAIARPSALAGNRCGRARPNILFDLLGRKIVFNHRLASPGSRAKQMLIYKSETAYNRKSLEISK